MSNDTGPAFFVERGSWVTRRTEFRVPKISGCDSDYRQCV